MRKFSSHSLLFGFKFLGHFEIQFYILIGLVWGSFSVHAQPATATFSAATTPVDYRNCIETFNSQFKPSVDELNQFIKGADGVVKDGVIVFNKGAANFNQALLLTKSVSDHLNAKDSLNADVLNSNTEAAKKLFLQAEGEGKLAVDFSEEATARFQQANQGQSDLFVYLNSCRDFMTQRKDILDDLGSEIDTNIAILLVLRAGQVALGTLTENAFVPIPATNIAINLTGIAQVTQNLNDFFGPAEKLNTKLQKDPEDKSKNQKASEALNLLKKVNLGLSATMIPAVQNMIVSSTTFLGCAASVAPPAVAACQATQSSIHTAQKVVVLAEWAAGIAASLNALNALNSAKSENKEQLDEMQEFLNSYDGVEPDLSGASAPIASGGAAASDLGNNGSQLEVAGNQASLVASSNIGGAFAAITSNPINQNILSGGEVKTISSSLSLAPKIPATVASVQAPSSAQALGTRTLASTASAQKETVKANGASSNKIILSPTQIQKSADQLMQIMFNP